MKKKIKCKVPDCLRKKLSPEAKEIEDRISLILKKIRFHSFSEEINLKIEHAIISELLCRRDKGECDICPSLQHFCPSCGILDIAAFKNLCTQCGTPISFGCSWINNTSPSIGFKEKGDFLYWVGENCRPCFAWNFCALFVRIRNDCLYVHNRATVTIADWKMAFVDGGGTCLLSRSYNDLDRSLRMSRLKKQGNNDD